MKDVPTSEICAIDRVQLAMPAGGEDDARLVYADDPFGNRMELLEQSDTLRGPP